jgi:dihydrofolate reductase
MIRARMSISLDGFSAGPDQGPEDPIGKGGMRLQQWQLRTAAFFRMQGRAGGEDSADSAIVEHAMDGVGAHVMGRRMFGGGDGPWDESWRGWWGDEPPFHAPVFVLTHHPRDPLPMAGGTTFHFVTEGFDAALDRAREAAGSADVAIAGGASTVRQALAAGALDELLLHLVPVVLGAGERPLDGIGDVALEQVSVTPGTGVAHLRYRVAH